MRVTYELREVRAIADHLEETFRDDETPGQNLLLRLLLDHLLHNLLEIFHVIMLVPLDNASGGFQSFANRIVDHLISYNDITSLAKGRDDTGDS